MKYLSRTEYSILNIIAGLGGYVLNTILGFVCRMFFVRYLAVDYLGVNGLFTNILSMLSLAELGIGGAIVYALYKPLANHDEEKIASLVQLYGKAYRIIGLVIGMVGLCLLPFLNFIITSRPDIEESIYLLYFINLFNTVITYFFSYKSSLIIAAQQNYIVSGINYLVTILQSIMQIITLALTRNYLLYLAIQTVGTMSYNIIISKIADINYPYIKSKKVKEIPSDEKKEIYKNIKDLTIYKISSLLVNSTDNIIITFFNGLSITGIASNYTLLVNTLNGLLGQLFNGLTASVGNHNATEEDEKKYELFSFLNMMNFWIFGWATLGIIFCSTDMIRLFFGEEYVLPIYIPMVMALNFYTVGLQNAIWTYKHTLGLFHYGRFLQILTGLLNIIFSIILGKSFGLFGILFATFLARLCTNLWYDCYAVFKYGFHKSVLIYIKKYIKYLIILTITAIVITIVFSFVDGSILFVVAVKIVLCSLIANIMFYICLKNTKEFERLKVIICRFLNMSKLKRFIRH